MKLTLAIVAALAIGGAAFGAPSTGPNQPTAQGPYYPVTGAQLYYWNHTLGYSVPADDVTGFPVNCISGCSGGSGGGGWSGGSTSAPGYVSQVIGGAVLSASNPSDDQLFYNGSAVSGTNGLPTTDTADGSPATAYSYPTGAAGLEGVLSDQVARQTTGNGSLATIATNSGTQATSANQTTGNTSLVTIANNTAPGVKTTGGASTYSAQGGTSNALLTATAVLIKGSAGNIYGIDFVNTGTVGTWVQIFDAATAGAVTLGTTVPLMAKYVPPNGGSWEQEYVYGAAFVNGLVIAATTTATGSTAPVTGIAANVEYK